MTKFGEFLSKILLDLVTLISFANFLRNLPLVDVIFLLKFFGVIIYLERTEDVPKKSTNKNVNYYE